MERKIVLLNGSPRAPKSNSKRYAAIFREHCPVAADYFEITRRNHAMLCSKMDEYTDVVLVFPLYADSLPVSLLDFLKSWSPWIWCASFVAATAILSGRC